MTWLWLLGAWMVLNLGAVFFLSYWLNDYTAWDCVFIYPVLNDWLEYKEYNQFGCWFIRVAFTILFLPYLILHFTALLLFVVFVSIVSVVLDIVDRLFKKKKK